MIYGLDVRKPIVKLYQGSLDRACTNLCVFSPSFLDVKELEPTTPIDFKPIKSLLEQTSDIRATLIKLSNTEVEYDDKLVNENLGKWVRNCLNLYHHNDAGKVKLATSSAISAYKLLYEQEDSRYYVGHGNTTDMLNVYGAWTQVITDDVKDILNKPEKTLLVRNILGI